MAVSSLVYAHGIQHISDATISWAASAVLFDCSLVLDSEVPDKDVDEHRDDVSEATGSGNAKDITSTVATLGTDEVLFGTSDTLYTFAAADIDTSQTIGGLLVFRARGGLSSADEIVCLCDFAGGNVNSDGVNDIVVTPHSDGFFKITV